MTHPSALPGAAERGLLALLLLSPGRIVAARSPDRLWSETTLPADSCERAAADGVEATTGTRGALRLYDEALALWRGEPLTGVAGEVGDG